MTSSWRSCGRVLFAAKGKICHSHEVHWLRGSLALFGSVSMKRNRRDLGIEVPLRAQPAEDAPADGLRATRRQAMASISQAAERENWKAARGSFGELIDQACNAALRAADRCHQLEEAFAIYKDIRCKVDFPMHASTFTPLIRLAGRQGQLQRAHALLGEMRERSVTATSHTYVALVGSYKAAGDVEGARQAYQEMKTAGVAVNSISLCAIMSAVAQTGDIAATEALLAEAQGHFPLSASHLNCILDACRRSNDASAAHSKLREYKSQGSIVPDVVSYTTVLSAMRSAGCVAEEVEALVQEMRAQGVQANQFFMEEYISCILGMHLGGRDAAAQRQQLLDKPAEVLHKALAVLQEAKDQQLSLTRLAKLTEPMLQAALEEKQLRAAASAGGPSTGQQRGQEDWVMVRASATSPEYYWDRASGRTQWERPASPVAATVDPA
eukprot:TRINITY_DN58093_c0_g1_i1.p1 TRINITY_DN58093_c0_g1~~TRINITY_DN58093_c0_g1_i1.p1  ORF type:complete len:440 (-),score=89.19 TRINITY_DN58093_c0_g1_i1:400-1719(-)